MKKTIIFLILITFFCINSFALDITPNDQTGQPPQSGVIVVGMPELQAMVSQANQKIDNFIAQSPTKADIENFKIEIKTELETSIKKTTNDLISTEIIILCVYLVFFYSIFFLLKSKGWL